jgi:hypothetical protein
MGAAATETALADLSCATARRARGAPEVARCAHRPATFRHHLRRHGSVRAKWSKAGSTVLYTPLEVKALTPIRETVEKRAELPDIRDIFLCHAWADRLEDATELYDLLKARGVSVWFSEKDIPLGSSFLREIDRGLAKSRIGLVLVTPALLLRLPTGGVADRELSALLATDQLVPIIHNTTYDALRDVSPLLASRNGLSTGDDTLAVVADKLADLSAT